jgi:branched-chain amino acid transport system permease protein
MDVLLVSLVNGLSYGLLLFLLCSGLTLIYSLMGVLNFAHAAFYVLGAYLAYSLSQFLGFAWALVLAPLLAAAGGALFESQLLRRVRDQGHVAEMLITFGLSLVLLEAVQLVWGTGPVNYRVPAQFDGVIWRIGEAALPAYRVFIMAVAVLVLLALAAWLRLSSVGLVIKAALTHPQMVQALGHDLPRVLTSVFALGCALAALAGVLGGNAFVTEPGMAATIGSVLFVVIVVGGLGSLAGALLASLVIGLLQTLAVGLDVKLGQLLALPAHSALAQIAVSQLAPLLPFALMVLVLLLRPRGLLGQRV